MGERGDRRNNREKEELREILRVTTRGIQFACVKLIVRRLNELAIHFRENKPSIDNLRQQLTIVRRPVRLLVIVLPAPAPSRQKYTHTV